MNDSQFFPPQEPAFPPPFPPVKSEEEDPTFPAIDFDDLSFDDVIMTSPLCHDPTSNYSPPTICDPFPDGFYSGGLDFPLDHDLGQASSFQFGGFLDDNKFDPGRSSLRELIESNVKSEKKPFNFGRAVEDRKVDKSLFEFSTDQKSFYVLFLPAFNLITFFIVIVSLSVFFLLISLI